jgi:hypothetical protein
MPFLPKTSVKLQNYKISASYSVFAQHFEEKLCEIREKALDARLEWIEACEKQPVIMTWSETIFFKSIHLKGLCKGKIKLKNIYNSKASGKKIYRFSIESTYSCKKGSKPANFIHYLTLED